MDSELLEPDDVAVIEERSEASVAEPSAFALFGLAVGTFVLAYPIAGFVPAGALTGSIGPILILAGIVQFIGGLFALRRGNAFAGTTFCILGGHYATVAMFVLLGVTIFPAAGAAPALTLALELYCFGYITLALGLIALRLSALHAAVLLPLVAGYVLTGTTIWYGASMPGVLTRIGGYCLIASAAFAAYAATATVANSTIQHNILPLLGAGGQTTLGRHRRKERRRERRLERQDGAAHDGAVHDGAVHDGAVHDGAARDGAAQDGGTTTTAPAAPPVARDEARPMGEHAATDERGRPASVSGDDMTRVDDLPAGEPESGRRGPAENGTDTDVTRGRHRRRRRRE